MKMGHKDTNMLSQEIQKRFSYFEEKLFREENVLSDLKDKLSAQDQSLK